MYQPLRIVKQKVTEKCEKRNEALMLELDLFVVSVCTPPDA